MSTSESKQESFDAVLGYFNDIKVGWVTKKSFGWELSVRALQGALQYFGTPESDQFLDDHLVDLIRVLGMQNSSKNIGMMERRCVEESMVAATAIVLRQLPGNTKYLPVLLRCLDSATPFYAGVRQNFQYYPGYPAARLQVGAKFAEYGGFKVILDLIRRPETGWLGTDKITIIAKTLAEQSHLDIVDGVGEALVQEISSGLLTMSEEQAKKENSDSVTQLIRYVGLVLSRGLDKAEQIANAHAFHKFWLEYANKSIQSGSLVLKLFGWEQMIELVKEAIQTRPQVSAYEVRGAGTDYVNGVYTYHSRDTDGFMMYTKNPTTEDMPLLSLYRSSLRNSRAKNWFISNLEKEYDYYQHKSLSYEDKEPQSRGWVSVSTNANAIGKAPAPILYRHGPPCIPPEVDESLFLFNFLPRWCLEGGILEQAFRSSAHREVVSRAGHVVTLLAEAEQLTKDHLHMIWKTAILCHNADVADEIFSLLVTTCAYLNDDLYCAVIGFALDLLSVDASSSSSAAGAISCGSTAENYSKVSLFVERFSRDTIHDVAKLTDASSAALFSLVWAVHKHPGFDSLKVCGIIQDFLASCLGSAAGQRLAMQHIVEGLEQLPLAGDEIVLSPLSEPGIIASESQYSRIIQTISFLVLKAVNGSMLSDLVEKGFPARIIAELSRFLLRNRPRYVSKLADPNWYCNEIMARLVVLRQFYGLVPALKLPLSMTDSLWELLHDHPCEVECLFTLFTSGATNRENLLAVADYPEFLYIYKNFICNDSVDWSKLGEKSFECFDIYFKGLQSTAALKCLEVSTRETSPYLGLDTLWNIVFNIPDAESHRLAVGLLIKSYEDFIMDEVDAHHNMVQRIFVQLKQLSESEMCKVVDDQTLRCLELLNTVVGKSKPSLQPVHALRGCMQRIKITVHHRKVSTVFTYATQSNTLRTEKGSDVTVVIDAHPLHTVKALKQQIALAVGQAVGHKITLEHDLRHALDSDRLSEYGIVGDSTVYAYSYASFAGTKVYDADSISLDNSFDYDLNSLPSIGQTISDDKDLFNMLLQFAETHSNPDVVVKVWALLMMIPTQQDLYYDVCSSAVDHDHEGASSWSFLVQGSLPRRAYMLQIVDYMLQPSPDAGVDDGLLIEFKQKFLVSGGFLAVIELFTSIEPEAGDIAKVALAIALHLMHFVLFAHGRANHLAPQDELDTPDTSRMSSDTDGAKPTLLADAELLALLQANSSQVIEKLLSVASHAAAMEDSLVVRDALVTLTSMLKTESAAAQLIGNPYSKTLLITVLRSGSKVVREMAAEFAIQVGKSQSIVFSWLLAEFRGLKDDDNLCEDICYAMVELIAHLYIYHSQSVDWNDLTNLLVSRIYAIADQQETVNTNGAVVLGHLSLLDSLIRLDAAVLSAAEVNLVQLARTLVNRYLFPLPTTLHDLSPICDTVALKKAAFSVLSALLFCDHAVFEFVIGTLSALASNAATTMRDDWGIQISSDLKRPDIQFSGLKNQGCTCYSNSLLQQLFMNVSFREAILNTPLKECHRSTVSHLTHDELVGCKILLEWENGAWRQATVLNYDDTTGEHTVEYVEGGELVSLALAEGRYKKETGAVKLMPADGELPITDREAGAYRVLEQLQRTFCFMKYSKRRYFDPRPLVEACKTLNLNFNVFQQNDASEFCDQLLDRIELATKGKHSGKDVWTNEILSNIFGGKTLTQKIPQACEHYETDKKQCGHWQSSRQESFLKIELIIRGKDAIHDSIAELVAGELMDGDNKINCDVCMEKKATVRRTCFDVLPNMMIIHLKRFDLDFTTFETVKLNNRLAFDTRLNMLKYTKEGIEAEERAAAKKAAAAQAGDGEGVEDSTDVNIQYETDYVEPDPDNYEYELQGVLVHAGVAQGGHYYSFAKDPSTVDKWYRFDDEDVSPFNPEQIPAQCFGGPQSSGSSAYDVEDRSSNALMLFYNKVKPFIRSTASESETVANATGAEPTDASVASSQLDSAPVGARLVNGYQAFYGELQAWNLEHLLSRYVLDVDLHTFVRDIFEALVATDRASSNGLSIDDVVLQWYNSRLSATVPMQLVQFGCTFLLDVVLKCRERSATRAWVSVLKLLFNQFKDTAVWFVRVNMNTQACSWFRDFLLTCTDPLARATYVQVLSAAILAISPSGGDIDAVDLLACGDFSVQELVSAALQEVTPTEPLPRTVIVPLLYLVVTELLEHVLHAPNHARVADEIFVLIREISAVPCICQAMLQLRVVSRLGYLILPDVADLETKSMFLERVRTRSSTKQDTAVLHQSIFEALAALLGVPQIRKVQLIKEISPFEYELVPDAREAFVTLFQEQCPRGMDAHEIVAYKEKAGTKVTLQQARITLARSVTNAEGKLSLEGFLQYYCELASYNPKDVWKDLTAFGFRNDLSRIRQASPAAVSGPDRSSESGSLKELSAADNLATLSPECRLLLTNIHFYQAGLEASEASAKAIARRVCTGNVTNSIALTHAALVRISELSPDYAWAQVLTKILDLLQLMLSIEDGLMEARLREILLDPSVGFAPIINTQERLPLKCRMNEYDQKALMKRYVGFMQDLCIGNPAVQTLIRRIAEEDPVLRHAKGHMRARPDSLLTENEDRMIRNSVVRVQGAGVTDINGNYTFSKMRCNAASFVKPGVFNGQPVEYTLYKCNVQTGAYQWFISIAPEGKELGTMSDIDFYYAPCRMDAVDVISQSMPPVSWALAQSNVDHIIPPAPRVTWMQAGIDSSLGTPAPPSTAPPSTRPQVSQPQSHQQPQQVRQRNQIPDQNISQDGFSDSDLEMNTPDDDGDDDDDDDLNDSTFGFTNTNSHDTSGDDFLSSYGRQY